VTNPSTQSPSALADKTATRFHWLLSFLLAAAFALEIISFFQPLIPSAGTVWLDVALVLLAAAGTITALQRQLPLQNVLLAVFGIAVIGGGFSALDAKTGMPFGPLIFTSGMGTPLFKTLPWPMPLIWVIVILNSRGVARLILRPWRKTKTYGFRVIGLTAALAAAFDFAFEPFASHVKHCWLWERTNLPLTWAGAPLVNFLVWAFVTALILLFVTPVLINKNPRPKNAPDFHPLCLWLGAIAMFGAGCAANGIWPPVFADAAIGIVAAVFAIRGARW
jgi:uncharacterized membrane protein